MRIDHEDDDDDDVEKADITRNLVDARKQPLR